MLRAVFLALCVWVLIAGSRSYSGIVIGAFCVLFAVLYQLDVVLRRPGREHGRPVIARVDDGTGPVEAVRFGPRRALLRCVTGACFVMAAVLFGTLAVRARAYGLSLLPGTALGPAAALGYLLLIAGACMAWATRRTRFIAVTADALVLAHRKTRVRVPWDDIAEARPVTTRGRGTTVDRTRRKATRSIALRPYAHAVAVPEFAPVILRFGGVRFLSQEAGAVPAIDVDGLVAPYALLRAVRWHLTHPHTRDALMEGYERGWRTENAPIG